MNYGDKVVAGCPKRQCHKSKCELNKVEGEKFVKELPMV